MVLASLGATSNEGKKVLAPLDATSNESKKVFAPVGATLAQPCEDCFATLTMTGRELAMTFTPPSKPPKSVVRPFKTSFVHFFW
jgi:hypothetical protein